MLITYCLTVRLLARQQQSLCGGGSGSGNAQPNGWASGWLGQQPPLGKNTNVAVLANTRRWYIQYPHGVEPNIILIIIWFIIKIRRKAMYLASITQDKSAVDTKSCSFCHVHRHRAIHAGYTRTVAARFKVSARKPDQTEPNTWLLAFQLQWTMRGKCLDRDFRWTTIPNKMKQKMKIIPFLFHAAYRSQRHRQWPHCINSVPKCWNYRAAWTPFHRQW